MTKFSPGQSGNPGGRPRGSKNRADQELKDWVRDFVDGQRNQFKRDMKALTAGQRVKIMEKLFGYVIPRKQSISMDEVIEAEYKEIERLINLMPDEGLERLEEKIVQFLELKNQRHE